jgi:hypothetical protein
MATLIGFRMVPAVAVLVTGMAFCSPTYDASLSVPIGAWGGDHIGLEVTDKGAQADFDCAHGRIDEPMTLDGGGRFDARGSFTAEGPGPQREGQNPPDQSARYSGRVQGSTMTITISLTESGETLGPFALTRGKTPKITKCL